MLDYDFALLLIPLRSPSFRTKSIFFSASYLSFQTKSCTIVDQVPTNCTVGKMLCTPFQHLVQKFMTWTVNLIDLIRKDTWLAQTLSDYDSKWNIILVLGPKVYMTCIVTYLTWFETQSVWGIRTKWLAHVMHTMY